MELGVLDRDDAVGQTQIAHELVQLRKLRGLRGKVLTGEFHEQDRVGRAPNGFLDCAAEGRDFARQLDHRSIDELDGGGSELDDVPSEIHGFVERRKVHDAEHFVRGQRRKLELDAPKVAERALRADEHVRHVERTGRDHVEVVPGDTALHFRHASLYLLPLALEQRAHRGSDVEFVSVRRRLGLRRNVAEHRGAAAREPSVNREDVVHHVAVAHRARTATVVRGHAADRRLSGRRHVDRIPEAMALELRIQVIEHDSRLDPGRAPGHVELEQLVQVLAVIDYEGCADGLTALRGSRAARQDRYVRVRGNRKRGQRIAFVPRYDDAERLDLVNRGIGRVTAARKRVEEHFAFELLLETRLQ